MNKKFLKDYEKRMHKQWKFWRGVSDIMRNVALRYVWVGRIAEKAKNPISRFISKLLLHHYYNSFGLSIPFFNTGEGLCISYPYSIIVNGGVHMGNDVTLCKGSEIGSVRSGKRRGVPTIGNHVVVCCNAVIVGNVNIGDDVLIAANSFVNFDVPDHSVVIGNPGVIHHKENAAADYSYGYSELKVYEK